MQAGKKRVKREPLELAVPELYRRRFIMTHIVARTIEETRDRGRAHRAVAKAIWIGELARPENCEGCGKTPPRNVRGLSQIQGHHHKGYENPLDVRWLCPKCHRDASPGPYEDMPSEPFDILDGGTYGSADRRSNLPQLQYLYDPKHPDRNID